MLYCKSYCFFVFYCARQVGRVLSTRPGFFLSFFRSKRGEVFSSCGWSLVLFQVWFPFLFHKLLSLFAPSYLLNKSAVSSEHAIAYGVWLLLSRTGMVVCREFRRDNEF